MKILNQEKDCLIEELKLVPELLKSQPDNDCIKRRLERQLEIDRDLQRLEKNLQSLPSVNAVMIPPKQVIKKRNESKKSSDYLKSNADIKLEQLREALDLANNVSDVVLKTKTQEKGTARTSKNQRSEIEKKQFEQLFHLSKMVSKLNKQVENFKKEKQVMTEKINSYLMSSSFDNRDKEFQDKSDRLRQLKTELEKKLKKLEIAKQNLRSQELQQNSKSQRTTTNTRSKIRLVKDIETGETFQVVDESVKDISEKVGRGDDPPSDPSDDGSSSSDDEKPPNRNPNDSNEKSRKGSGSDSKRGNVTPQRQTVVNRPTYGKKPNIKDFDGDISNASLWMESFVRATNTMILIHNSKRRQFREITINIK